MTIPDFVKKYDSQNQFDVLINTYKQVETAWNNKIDLNILKNKNIDSILATGLGGSAISADLIQNFLGDELKLPFIVNRNYFLPSFAGKNTLVVASSYSGNTEETLEVYKAAVEKGCSIVCISTGGKLEKLAAENKVPVVKVPAGLQPRFALGLSFFSLLKILQELSIVPDQDSVVQKIIKLWKEKGEELSKENNQAYSAAERLVGFIPVIYSAADMTSAAGYRLKCQFNENSKLHAFNNIIPELNHNEIVGWESFTENQLHAKLILIIDKNYHPQIKKRFEITSGLIAGKNVEALTLESNEDDFKVRLMDLIYLGDWITYYSALLRGFDPTEIDNINTLKQKLG